MLDRLLVPQDSTHGVLEFGCGYGYGTFTLPAASRTRGRVTALDIEPSMVSLVAQRAKCRFQKATARKSEADCTAIDVSFGIGWRDAGIPNSRWPFPTLTCLMLFARPKSAF